MADVHFYELLERSLVLQKAVFVIEDLSVDLLEYFEHVTLGKSVQTFCLESLHI